MEVTFRTYTNKMRNKIKLTSYNNGEVEGTENNYNDFIGYCPRPMKLEIVLTTKQDAEELIDFLNQIKTALVNIEK